MIGEPARLTAAFQELNGDRTGPWKAVSTYYDSEDGRLCRRGFFLRLRERGDGFELTLKRQGGKALDSGEWTSDLDKPMVDIGLLPRDAPRGEIGAILPEELQPRFRSEVERSQQRLELDGAAVLVSLDIGHIIRGARETPMAELAFELLDGPVPVMLAKIKSSLRRHRLAVGVGSEAARGMQLVEDMPPAPVKTAKPALAKSDSIETAVAKIVTVTTKQIMANLAAADDGRDPEGVHQLRVALRRLRSALTLFEDHLAGRADLLDNNARRALKQLGPARDLDVFLLETLPPVASRNSDNAGLSRLMSLAEARKHEAYARVRELIGEPIFNRFLLDLMLVAEEGGLVVRKRTKRLRPTAAALLRKRHKRVIKLGKGFARLSHPQRHRVRLALKKLRYAADYFQTLYPKKPTRAYLKRLASLQDDLGRLNDAAVAEELVDRLTGGDSEAAIGAALIKGWYRHRLEAVEPHMLEAWHRFAAAQPFWRT